MSFEAISRFNIESDRIAAADDLGRLIKKAIIDGS